MARGPSLGHLCFGEMFIVLKQYKYCTGNSLPNLVTQQQSKIDNIDSEIVFLNPNHINFFIGSYLGLSQSW